MKQSQPKTKATPCTAWATRIALYANNNPDDLTTDERIAVQNHLKSCDSCASVYAFYQDMNAAILRLSTVQLTAQHLATIEHVVSDDSIESVELKLPEHELRPVYRHSRHIPGWIGAIAATLLLTILAGSSLLLFSRHMYPGSASVNVQGTLYTLSSRSGIVYAIDAANGQILWQKSMGTQLQTELVVSHGRLFVPSFDGMLYSLSTSNGKLLWQRSFKNLDPLLEPSTLQTPPLLLSLSTDDRALYFGSVSGIYAWSTSNGKQLWSHPLPPQCYISTGSQHELSSICSLPPFVSAVSNGILYAYFGYTGSGNGDLYALRTTDGAAQWHWHNQSELSTYINTFVMQRHLYLLSVGKNAAAITILQTSNGHVLNTLHFSFNPLIGAQVVGDSLYVSEAHDLYAIRDSDQSTIWHKQYDDAPLPYVEQNGVLYAMGTSHIYAMNAKDGSVRWQVKQFAQGANFAAFLYGQTNGLMYFTTQNGLYAVSTIDGKQVWHDLPDEGIAVAVVQ